MVIFIYRILISYLQIFVMDLIYAEATLILMLFFSPQEDILLIFRFLQWRESQNLIVEGSGEQNFDASTKRSKIL